jgi:uncharacterized protein YbjT (DUF2867 family)
MAISKKVCVFGGTGRYGRRVVASLLGLGARVRVPSRDAAAARGILGDAAEIAQGDVRDPDFVTRALEGVDAAVLALSAANARQIRQRTAIERDAVLGIIGAAMKAGPKRLVCFSGYAMQEAVLDTIGLRSFGAIMIEVEAALRASALDWTVLGCAPSYELFFSLFKGKAMLAPGGCAAPFPSVSEFDVGAIAAQAALRDDLGGQRFSLNGSEALTVPIAAERLGRALGRRIPLIKPPLAAIGAAAALISPFNPFPSFIYQSLKLLNSFPADLAALVPATHAKLQSTFDYKSMSLEDEIERRMGLGLLE